MRRVQLVAMIGTRSRGRGGRRFKVLLPRVALTKSVWATRDVLKTCFHPPFASSQMRIRLSVCGCTIFLFFRLVQRRIASSTESMFKQ
jgi:hypothetical protein